MLERCGQREGGGGGGSKSRLQASEMRFIISVADKQRNEDIRDKLNTSSINKAYFWRKSPPPRSQWARVSSITKFLYHTQRLTTVAFLWTRDQLVAETSTWQHVNTHNRQTSLSPVGFETTISAGERPKTYALDRASTGTGDEAYSCRKTEVRNFTLSSRCVFH